MSLCPYVGYMACMQDGDEAGSRQHVRCAAAVCAGEGTPATARPGNRAEHRLVACRRWAKSAPMVPQALQELLAIPARAPQPAASKGVGHSCHSLPQASAQLDGARAIWQSLFTCVFECKQGRAAARPHLLFPRSATHEATLEDCLIRPEWLWALASWLPRAQTEARALRHHAWLAPSSTTHKRFLALLVPSCQQCRMPR